MKHAIQSLKETAKSHENQVQRWEDFFNSEKFSEYTVEGSVKFAVEQTNRIYADVVKEIYEAVAILERIDGMGRARKKRGYRC